MPIDYDDYDVIGNSINAKNAYASSSRDEYDGNEATKEEKRNPELLADGQKRSIASALRSKIRRSKNDDIEDKYRFSPLLSVGELRWRSVKAQKPFNIQHTARDFQLSVDS